MISPLTLDDLLADAASATPPAPPPPSVVRGRLRPGPRRDPPHRAAGEGPASGSIRDWTLLDRIRAVEAMGRTFRRRRRSRARSRAPNVRTDGARQVRGFAGTPLPHQALLLGWHARGRLDERYEQRGLAGVWWTRRDEAMTEFEYADLPLPWKAVVRALKCVAWDARESAHPTYDGVGNAGAAR